MISPRLCSTCRQLKPITEFYRSTCHAGGYERRCKSCRRSHGRKSGQRPQDPLRGEEIRLSIRKTGDELLPWVVSDGQEINVGYGSADKAIKVKDVVLKYLTDEIPDRPIKVVYKSPTETALARRRQRAAQAA